MNHYWNHPLSVWGACSDTPFCLAICHPSSNLGNQARLAGEIGRRDKDGHVGLLPDVFQVRQKSRNAHLHEIEHTEVDSLHPTSLAMVLYELFCIASHNPQTPVSPTSTLRRLLLPPLLLARDLPRAVPTFQQFGSRSRARLIDRRGSRRRRTERQGIRSFQELLR